MAESLRDQLVKAGLATASQAKQAERQISAEQRAARKPDGGAKKRSDQQQGGKKTGASNPDKVRARARQIQAEKQKKDQALAAARNEKAAAKALRAEIRQIILSNDQRSTEKHEDDVPYNFLHGKKIKRIYIPKAQVDALSNGTLAIVNNDGRYHLVSSEVAERLRDKNPKCVIAAHDSTKEAEPEDEYYARFKVPDDLDW